MPLFRLIQSKSFHSVHWKSLSTMVDNSIKLTTPARYTSQNNEGNKIIKMTKGGEDKSSSTGNCLIDKPKRELELLTLW